MISVDPQVIGFRGAIGVVAGRRHFRLLVCVAHVMPVVGRGASAPRQTKQDARVRQMDYRIAGNQPGVCRQCFEPSDLRGIAPKQPLAVKALAEGSHVSGRQ
jgi:hypothetical protein